MILKQQEILLVAFFLPCFDAKTQDAMTHVLFCPRPETTIFFIGHFF